MGLAKITSDIWGLLGVENPTMRVFYTSPQQLKCYFQKARKTMWYADDRGALASPSR